MPRRHEGQRECRCVHEIDGVGQRDQVLRRNLDQLGVAARMIEVAEHLVARALVVSARQAGLAAPATYAGLHHHALAGGNP